MYKKCVSFSGTLMKQFIPHTKLKMHLFNKNKMLVYFFLWIYQICTNHSKCMLKNCQTSNLQIRTSFNSFHASVQVWPLAEQGDLVQKITQIVLTYLPITRKRSRQPPNLFSFSDSQIVRGNSCAISDFFYVNEKSAIWYRNTLICRTRAPWHNHPM